MYGLALSWKFTSMIIIQLAANIRYQARYWDRRVCNIFPGLIIQTFKKEVKLNDVKRQNTRRRYGILRVTLKNYSPFVCMYTKWKARIWGIFFLAFMWTLGYFWSSCLCGKHLSLMSNLVSPRVFSKCQLALHILNVI